MLNNAPSHNVKCFILNFILYFYLYYYETIFLFHCSCNDSKFYPQSLDLAKGPFINKCGRPRKPPTQIVPSEYKYLHETFLSRGIILNHYVVMGVEYSICKCAFISVLLFEEDKIRQ